MHLAGRCLMTNLRISDLFHDVILKSIVMKLNQNNFLGTSNFIFTLLIFFKTFSNLLCLAFKLSDSVIPKESMTLSCTVILDSILRCLLSLVENTRLLLDELLQNNYCDNLSLFYQNLDSLRFLSYNMKFQGLLSADTFNEGLLLFG